MEKVMDDQSLMREWTRGPFRLELHELGEPGRWLQDGKTPIGYRFYHHDQLVFESDDIAVPAGQTLDGDQTFRGYTPTQLAWRDQHAEDLAGLLAEWDDPNPSGLGQSERP
jgi:hypothetical protein